MRIILGLVFSFMFAGASFAQGPTLVWEAKGLARPESVVHDPATDVLYVSNINGPVMQKDGNGFISRLKSDGTILERNWATGFDSPTGLGLRDRTLYVADVDALVEVDAASGSIKKRHPANGAIFLNDVAVAEDGTVYVSDTPMNTIWRLKDGVFEPWLTSDELEGPNGLLVEGDKLTVASLGRLKSVGQEQEPAGMFSVNLEDQTIEPLAKGKTIGNLDGLQVLKPGAYLVTDWPDGALYQVNADGKVDLLIDLNQGSADLTYSPETGIALIPMMLDNSLAAYRLSAPADNKNDGKKDDKKKKK
jgi:sugar lactone lactonase YvrE